MLGTMAGLWISAAMLVVCVLICAVAFMGKGDSEIKVEDKSILYFDLSGDVTDVAQEKPFMELIQSINDEAPTLHDMLRSLELAAKDDDIEGLYINCGGSGMGSASREELVAAILEFKKSGKWVISYADSYSQGDYLVASAADSVMLNPVGSIDIHGVGASTPFFKGLLDKLGVKMQIIKVGTFKSAVEPYVLTEMSQPARQQMQQYCDTIWKYVSSTIAINRGIPVDSIHSMASQMINTRMGDVFIKNGLADSLLYKYQFDNLLRAKTGIDDDEDLRLISPAQYISAASIKNIKFSADEDEHIAVYYAEGEISDAGEAGIVGPRMSQDIIDLADDDNVRGLVLRVNSPGGSAFASEQIWAALQYFKSKNKPLYVSMGDYAASGGYYISCGADTIYADATTLTGSIGVFGMIPDLSGLVTGKLGVNFSTVQTNPNAAINTMEALTPEQLAAMQHSVEDIYALFTGRVAAGREMDIDSVRAIAEGRVWTGVNAVELGLADYLGTLDMTVAAMCRDLKMKKSQVKTYPAHEEKMWQQFLREAGNIESKMPFDMETMEQLYYIKRLTSLNPVQARMEPVLIK